MHTALKLAKGRGIRTNADDKEYLGKLNEIVDTHEQLVEYRALKFTKEVTLTEQEAGKYGLLLSGLPELKPTPTFFDDAIQAYLWIKDMPESFTKKVRRLKCLLRVYLMLIDPSKPELLDETFKALQCSEGPQGLPLIKRPEDVLPRIKIAIDDVIMAVPSGYDSGSSKAISEAKSQINKAKGTIELDRADVQNKDKLEKHPIAKAFLHLNSALKDIVFFNF
jgi:hypothetical protein